MSAMNGSAVSLRAGRRVIGCCFAVALALAAFVFAPVSANAAAPKTTTYLALGDSISFGFTEERFALHASDESPSFFEEGFTNDFTKDLGRSSEVGKTIRLVDDGCPGETSNGLIGENPEIGGEASTETFEEIAGIPAERFPAGGYQGLGDWHPCAYTYEDHLPLHNGGYILGGKEVSQLEEALGSLSQKAQEASPVKAITLQIGSNDELAAITQCKDEHGAEGLAAVIACIKTGAETILVPHILKNLGDIIGVIDSTGYTGPIVLLGFYNPDTFVLPGSDQLQEGLNAAVEGELLPGLAAEHIKNVAFANPFPIFNKGAATETKPQDAKVESKAICKFTEMCNKFDLETKGEGDIHPTVTGYKELAKIINQAYVSLAG
jgi:lysophospholipase L1-like esterase